MTENVSNRMMFSFDRENVFNVHMLYTEVDLII